MKKLISIFAIISLLFTSTASSSCLSVFGRSRIDHHIELSQKGLEDINKRLLDLEDQINPPIKKRLIKDLSYYAALTAALVFLANKSGYIEIPKTVDDVKNIKCDKNLFSYAVLGLVIRYALHPIVKLLGVDDLGPIVYSAISAGLAMYRTGTDPINQATIQAAEMFTKVNNLVNQANDIAPTAIDVLNQAATMAPQANEILNKASTMAPKATEILNQASTMAPKVNDILNQARENDVINKAGEAMDSYKYFRSWLPWNWFNSKK